MSRIKFFLLTAAFWLAAIAPSLAASSNVNSLTASGAIVGAQLFYCPVGAATDYKCTAAQIAAYNYSLMSGDCTASGTGAITCTKTNGTAFGTLATLALRNGSGDGPWRHAGHDRIFHQAGWLDHDRRLLDVGTGHSRFRRGGLWQRRIWWSDSRFHNDRRWDQRLYRI